MADYDSNFGSPEQDDMYETSKAPRKSSKGRTLVRWNPDMDQLVLLCVDTVCTKLGTPIPWNEVAQEVKPNLSGEAIKQHLAKVHKYRSEAGMKVPEKLDRKVRRQVAGNAVGRGRGKKQSDEEGEQEEAKKPVQRGASLLYMTAAPKRKVQQKTSATPKAPGTSRGRKKGSKGEATPETQATVKTEPEEESDYEAPKAKGRSGGSKRARKPKVKEDDDEDYGSPSKKPKTTGYLRSQPSVDYSEQLDVDADAVTDDAVVTTPEKGRVSHKEDEETVSGGSGSKKTWSTQGSVYDMPPPQFAGTARPGFYQQHSAPVTPGYDFDFGTTQYTSSPNKSGFLGTPFMPSIEPTRMMYGHNSQSQVPYTSINGPTFGGHSGNGMFAADAIGDASAPSQMSHTGGQVSVMGDYGIYQSVTNFTPINAQPNSMPKIETDDTFSVNLDGHTDFDAAAAMPMTNFINTSTFAKNSPTALHVNTQFPDHTNMTISPTDLSSSGGSGHAGTGITSPFDHFMGAKQKHHGSFDSGYGSIGQDAFGLGTAGNSFSFA